MSSNRVNFLEIEIFCALQSYSSVRALARAKRLQPSHVSKILSRLEAKTETQLTIRTPSGVKLTQEGMAFMREARQILLRADTLFSKGPRKAEKKKIISLGGMSFINKWLLAPLLRTMDRLDSDNLYRLVDFSPSTLVSAGIEGAFDLAVHTDQMAWPRSWVSHKIGYLTWTLVARSDHPLAPASTALEVSAYPFVGPCYWDKGGYERGNDHCPLAWSKRVHGHETTTADTAAEIVKYSDCVAYLPRLVLGVDKNRDSLTEVSVAGWTNYRSPVYVAAKADQIKDREFQKIKSLIQQGLNNPI